MDLLLQLTQFVLRLAFGLALGMALVSPKQVTSGYFRNQLYVLLGLAVLAALVSVTEDRVAAAWFSGGAAVFSYIGSVMWLYEKPIVGRAMLVFVAAATLSAAWLNDTRLDGPIAQATTTEATVGEAATALQPWQSVLHYADAPTGGAVLGFTMAAMLLGHWYLNSPTMQLEPLNRLLAWTAGALVVRVVVASVGLGWQADAIFVWGGWQWAFLAIRWLAGLIGTAVLVWMAWRTLKIPNTQSATGILYVAVISTFTGELAAQLLSAQSVLPL